MPTTAPQTSSTRFALFFPALIAVFAILLAGCAGPGGARVQAVLKVGVTPSLPPFVFKEDGAYKGIEPDFARALAASLGREVRFVPLEWNDQIPALLSGKTDIVMSGMSITSARRIRIQFTSAYMKSGQCALVRQSELDHYRLFLLSGKYRVGVQDGTTGDFFARKNLSQAERVAYATPRDAALGLADHQVDVVIHDAPVNWWLASEYEASGLAIIDAFLTTEYVAWGVTRESTDLLNAANQYITQATASGELNQIIRSWIPSFGSP